MAPFLRSVSLKLARADDQTQALAKSIDDWSARNPILAESQFRDGRLGFLVIQKEFAEPPPLDDWALISGEIIHNIRSALDNLAFALARMRCDPPEKPKQISFPIFTDREEFLRNGRRNITQLPDEAVLLIERLQPFQRDGSPQLGTPEQDSLVLLQSLSNADKHQVPAITLIAPTTITHNAAALFYSDEDAAANTPPDVRFHAGPLAPGAVLLEYRTNRPIASVNGAFEGLAMVALQSAGSFVEILATLTTLRSYVALVASQFDPFFEKQITDH